MNAMKHVKLFENFIAESRISGVDFEDVARIVHHIIKLMKDHLAGQPKWVSKTPELKSNGKLSDENLNSLYWIYYGKIGEGKRRSLHDKFYPFYPLFRMKIGEKWINMTFDVNKYVEVRAMYWPEKDIILFSDEWYNLSPLYRELILTHEIIHAADPFHEEYERNGPLWKILGVKTYEEFRLANYDLDRNPNAERFLNKRNFATTTEREAYTSMMGYMLTKMLLKYPERTETVRTMIRKGNWKIDEVFDELDFLSGRFNDMIATYEKTRKSLLRKYAKALDTQESLIHPECEVLGELMTALELTDSKREWIPLSETPFR